MQQEDFSPQDSLTLIESMINKARNRFSENGHLYLLWGWVVLICSSVSFISLYLYKDYRLFPVWFLTWAAIIYQFIYLFRKKKEERVKTYTDEISASVWLVFVVMGGLLAVILARTNNQSLFNTVLLILYGMPTFLSGVILKFNPLKIGALVCWLLAFISSMIPNEFSFLLLAIAVVTAWIVPGYLLRSRYQKQN